MLLKGKDRPYADMNSGKACWASIADRNNSQLIREEWSNSRSSVVLGNYLATHCLQQIWDHGKSQRQLHFPVVRYLVSQTNAATEPTNEDRLSIPDVFPLDKKSTTFQRPRVASELKMPHYRAEVAVLVRRFHRIELTTKGAVLLSSFFTVYVHV